MAYKIKEMDKYPQWICSACGIKHGKSECGLSTWHQDTCGVCKKETQVTEPRDFGHLKNTWKDELR